MSKTFFFVLISTFAATAASASETINLFGQPHAKPNPNCALGVHMDLQPEVKLIRLSNYVQGLCEIYAEPNPRNYQITQVRNNGGDTVYNGSNGNGTIQVIDHRKSMLDVVFPAMIEVKETTDGKTWTLYSAE